MATPVASRSLSTPYTGSARLMLLARRVSVKTSPPESKDYLRTVRGARTPTARDAGLEAAGAEPEG